MKLSTLAPTMALLLLFGESCTLKDHEIDPVSTCRLTGISGAFIDGIESQFEYDANGRIIRQTRDFGTDVIEYKQTYNASGQLIRSDLQDVYTDGTKYEGVETYTWTNGQIVQFSYENSDGTKGVNKLKYNETGQLTEFTIENDDPDPTHSFKWTYTYDANSVLIHRRVTTFDGKDLLFEARLTYTTKEIVKTAFSLMPKAGLPVDLVLGRAWESYYPKNDGTLSYYFPDQNGEPELFAKGTIKDMTFNQSGLATGWSYGDVLGDFTPVTFQVEGCP